MAKFLLTSVQTSRSLRGCGYHEVANVGFHSNFGVLVRY
jgi:hypothetical protein